MVAPLHIQTIVSQPFAENTYLVWLPGRSDVVVIDPGLQPDLILDFLKEQGQTVAAILNTHGHGDHIGGNQAMKTAFPEAPLIIGTGDAHMFSDTDANLSASFGVPITSPGADRTVGEGDVVEAAGLRFEVVDVPGHSPGHVAFVLRDMTPIHVFSGDVLFRGGIGRTDFPGSSGPRLLASIRAKLYVLSPDTVIYPGHGPVTTVAHERRTNPFVH